MINLKVRLKNPVFLLQIAGAVILPVLAYMGLTIEDMTSWPILGKTILYAVSNPYVLGLVALSVFNAFNDPTTSGITDTQRVLEYQHPNTDEDNLNIGESNEAK